MGVLRRFEWVFCVMTRDQHASLKIRGLFHVTFTGSQQDRDMLRSMFEPVMAMTMLMIILIIIII